MGRWVETALRFNAAYPFLKRALLCRGVSGVNSLCRYAGASIHLSRTKRLLLGMEVREPDAVRAPGFKIPLYLMGSRMDVV